MDIEVEKQDKPGGWTFDVTVEQGNDSTEHKVKMSEDYYQRIAKERCPPEEFVRESFRFLLERESKESILGSFNITTINRYFPEYENEIQKRI